MPSVGAQTVAAPAVEAPSAAASAPTAAQLESLVRTLEDEAARGRLVEQLQALIAAQQATDAAAGPAATEARPDTLGTRILTFAGDRVEGLSRDLGRLTGAFADLPRTADWLVRQVEDPAARDRWLQLAAALGLILVTGGIAARVVAWLLSGARRAIGARDLRSSLAKVPFLLLRALLDLVPVATFAVIAYGVLSVAEPPQRVRLAALALVNAAIVVQLVLLSMRALVAPRTPGIRLFRMADDTAVYVYAWVRRIAAVAVYGYFLTEAAYVLGLPLGAYGAVMKLLGLVIAAMLIVFILRNRSRVADWLGGHPLTGNGDAVAVAEREAAGQGAVLRSARRRMADVWHVVAILYVVVTFGVWVLNVYGGFEYLARATALTVAIAAVARLLVNGTDRLLRRALGLSSGIGGLPTLEDRMARWLPVLHRVVKIAIWAVAALAVLHAWGVDSLAWLETPLGQRMLGSLVSVGLMVVAAILAWEAVSAAIESYLTETDGNGVLVERSARARTLLPLLRNALLILLVTVVALITLSELGVNIAPLLAGAGVVGLAIGFGSQTLVKDVITGLFILFEDTISVGDVVDVGGGHSGVVEALSIRTLRLRDLSGSVHSIPFSAVTTVKNLTKDFSFAVFRVSVDYKEDPDRVIEVLKDIGAGMQAEPEFGRDILAPLEVMGLDQLADSGIVIMARFKTRPIRQWAIGREFNRRMKKRFVQEGISIPYPHMQLVMRDAPADRSVGEALGQGS